MALWNEATRCLGSKLFSSCSFSLFNQPQQILSVFGFEHILHTFADIVFRHPAVFVGDLLQAGDLESLAGFDRADEVCGVEHAVVRAGVQPGVAALEHFHVELAAPQVFVVHGGDLKLAACGRLDVFRDVDDVVVVEIQPRDGVVGFRLFRLLLDGDRIALGIEFDHAEAFPVAHVVAEHGRADLAVRCGPKKFAQLGAVEDVVAEHERHAVGSDELLADQERLREPLGFRLDGIAEVHAEAGTVTKQTFEAGLVFRRGDDQNVADARQHERADRVIDHRFVVYAEELFRDPEGDRVKTRSRAACQYDAFHVQSPVPRRSILYEPLSTCAHQSSLCSRYHSTVLRMPDSNVSCGFQPSSRAIFDGSMA